jgi:hypothetical protein
MGLFYTLLPLELVFAGIDEEREAVPVELPIQGGTLVVEPLGYRQARILRVISSDPRLFLEPRLQPGQVLDFSETSIL